MSLEGVLGEYVDRALLLGVFMMESEGERLSKDSLSASLVLRACMYSCTKESNLNRNDMI